MSTARTLAALGAVHLGREVAWSVASPVTNRVADAYDVYDRAAGAGRAAAYGLPRLAKMERVNVSGTFIHGPKDRRAALESLGLAWLAFEQDIIAAPATAADADFVTVDVAPALAGWTDFLGKIRATPIALYTVEWSTFDQWFRRLVNLRVAARARGVHLSAAEPEPLPKTIFQRGADGTGTQLDTWLTLGKVIVFGMIGISGIVGFFALARDARRWMNSPAEAEPEQIETGEHEHEHEHESEAVDDQQSGMTDSGS